MKVFIVTGSVGTGKTILAKKISDNLGFQYIDTNKIIKKCKLTDSYDKKRKTKVVDVDKLNKALIKEINKIKEVNKKAMKNDSIKKLSLSTKSFNKINKKTSLLNKDSKKSKTGKNFKRCKTNGVVIDSYLSHYLPRKYVDLCIVTKCNLKILKKRLKKRGYSKPKIRENMDVEIFDVCLNEAKEAGHRILVVDTTKGFDIYKLLESKKI